MDGSERRNAYVLDRETGSTGDLLAVNNQDDAHPARKLPIVIFRGSLMTSANSAKTIISANLIKNTRRSQI